MNEDSTPVSETPWPPESIDGCRILEEWGIWRELALFKGRDRDGATQVLVAVPFDEAQVAMNVDAMRSFDHPDIVRTLRVVEWEERQVAIFEAPGGETLRRRLVREVRLGVGSALNLLAQAAAGLLAGQARGLWHGGLDLDAVLLTDGGDVRLLGLGVQIGAEGECVPDEVPFRAPYFHPQRRQGDWRDDVMALGVITYTALTGRPPLAGKPVAELSRGLRRGSWPLGDLGGAEPLARLERLFERVSAVHLGTGIRSLTDLLLEIDAARKEAIARGLLAEESALTEKDRIQLRMEVLARTDASAPPTGVVERLRAVGAGLRERLPWARLAFGAGPAAAAVRSLVLFGPRDAREPAAQAASWRGPLPAAETALGGDGWRGAGPDPGALDGAAAAQAEAAFGRAQAFLRAFPEDRKGAEEALKRVALAQPEGRPAERAAELAGHLRAGAPDGAVMAAAEAAARAAGVFLDWEEFATARRVWEELKARTTDGRLALRAAAEMHAIEKTWAARNSELLDQARSLVLTGDRAGARARAEKVAARPASAAEADEARRVLEECGSAPAGGS
ncbi:MAG: hypothetical protein HZA54_00110 [Planctomycetes bacterium]|nr:hypothetical protein [Planctomycetota bacterium]